MKKLLSGIAVAGSSVFGGTAVFAHRMCQRRKSVQSKVRQLPRPRW